MELLKARGKQVICKRGLCRVIRIYVDIDKRQV
jgi:hypothetical protein